MLDQASVPSYDYLCQIELKNFLGAHMSDLHTLRELRSSVTAAANKHDDALQALVSAVAILSGKDLPIRRLLEAAGISKQTYYLRLDQRTPLPHVKDLDSLPPLKSVRNAADDELFKALGARTEHIAAVVHLYSAREISDAAGVSEVWVRKIRRRTAHRR